MRWFVVHTRTHAEKQAAAHLRNQGFTTYLPCYRKRRSHARRIEIVRAPVFPAIFSSRWMKRQRLGVRCAPP